MNLFFLYPTEVNVKHSDGKEEKMVFGYYEAAGTVKIVAEYKRGQRNTEGLDGPRILTEWADGYDFLLPNGDTLVGVPSSCVRFEYESIH